MKTELEIERDKRYALQSTLQLLESRASPIPCACGCEGCRADREEIRKIIGDWRAKLEAIGKSHLDA